MKATALFHDERTLWHVPGGLHALFMPVRGWVQPMAGNGIAPDSPESKRRVKALMDVSGLTDHVDVRSAPMASEEDLLRVHTAGYVQRFKHLSDSNGGEMGPVALFGPGSFEIASLSAGLVIAAMDSVVNGRHRNAYALSRPCGHHALPDQGMGFCLLNNIAIAIESVKSRHRIERIAVIDWDVHHGNGTQHMFYGRDDVLTLSLHQENCFPFGYSGANDRGEGRGTGFNINVPLLPGGGRDTYRFAFERIVIPAIDRYRPDLIVVASGLDANGADPLARMQLHAEAFREMTHAVKQLAARHCEGRIVIAHEGGYAEACVPFCGLAIMEELSGHRTAVDDPFYEAFEMQKPSERFMALQRELISEMAELHGL